MAQLNVELEYAWLLIEVNVPYDAKFDYCEEGLGNSSDKDKKTENAG